MGAACGWWRRCRPGGATTFPVRAGRPFTAWCRLAPGKGRRVSESGPDLLGLPEDQVVRKESLLKRHPGASVSYDSSAREWVARWESQKGPRSVRRGGLKDALDELERDLGGPVAGKSPQR